MQLPPGGSPPIAADRRGLRAQPLGDVRRLAAGGPIQPHGLECCGFGPTIATAADATLLQLVMAPAGDGAGW